MKIELKHAPKEELEKIIADDLWREKYRLKSIKDFTLPANVPEDGGRVIYKNQLPLDELDEGGLRPKSLTMNGHARAERSLFVCGVSNANLIQIQNCEQTRCCRRFLTLEEMQRIISMSVKLAQLSKDQYDAVYKWHGKHLPHVKTDHELSDGMNFQHAWDWISWEQKRDLLSVAVTAGKDKGGLVESVE
mgnify:CR=1 FL=1